MGAAIVRCHVLDDLLEQRLCLGQRLRRALVLQQGGVVPYGYQCLRVGAAVVRCLALDDLLEQRLALLGPCLLYTSPSPRDATLSRMPSSA